MNEVQLVTYFTLEIFIAILYVKYYLLYCMFLFLPITSHLLRSGRGWCYHHWWLLLLWTCCCNINTTPYHTTSSQGVIRMIMLYIGGIINVTYISKCSLFLSSLLSSSLLYFVSCTPCPSSSMQVRRGGAHHHSPSSFFVVVIVIINIWARCNFQHVVQSDWVQFLCT